MEKVTEGKRKRNYEERHTESVLSDKNIDRNALNNDSSEVYGAVDTSL